MISSNSNYISRKYIKHSDLVIEVESNLKMSMLWLEEFLQPSFIFLSAHESPDFKVGFYYSIEKHSAVVQELRNQKFSLVNIFSLNDKESEFHYYELSNEECIIIDRISNVVYVFNLGFRRVEIICIKENRHSRKSFMRVIRELVIGYYNRIGFPIIHAAAASLGENGVIIVGDKGAGKTTLLMNLLTESSNSFISNDRVVFNFNNLKPYILGLPSIVNVKKKTIDMFKEFKRNLESKSYDYNLCEYELDSDDVKSIQPDKNGNYSLSPFQFCKLINSKKRQNANLDLVLFPKVGRLGSKPRLSRLSAETASKKLLQNIMVNKKNILNSALLSCGTNLNTKINSDYTESLLKVTSTVKCYDFYLPHNSQSMQDTITLYLKDSLEF